MGFYAFFRLLWRPASILLVAYLGMTLAMVLVLSPPRFPTTTPLNLFTLIFPLLVGVYTGQVVGDLQHTLFSWTLPNLRRKLFSSVFFTGIVTALLVTWIYRWLGGPAPWLPVFTSVLLWYSMSIAFSTTEILESSVRFIRLLGSSFFTLLVLILAGFWINRIADLYTAQPLLCIALTILGASLYLYRIFNITAIRSKSLVPRASSGQTTGRSFQKEVMSWKRTSRRKWRLTGPITGLFNWIRAVEYENFGSGRIGWPAVAAVFSGMFVLVMMALTYRMGYGKGSHEIGIQFVYHIIFGSSSFKGDSNALLSLFTPLAVSNNTFRSWFLQKGWLYPLSRTQLTRLAYWSSLLFNAVSCGIVALVFLSVGGLIGLYAGYDAHFESIPGFIRPLTLAFIFTPAIQWVHLRYTFHMGWIIVSFTLFLCSVGTLSVLWFRVAPDISGTYEAVACAGLILLSQRLYLHKLETYFKRGDLV